MKNSVILLFVSVFIFASCTDKKKDLTNQYHTLIAQSDSIEIAHNEIMKTHQAMLAEHQGFVDEVKKMNIKDPAILEIIGKHDVLLKRHQALIKSHSDLIAGHKELKDEFNTLTEAQMDSEIKQMEIDHNKIISEQDTIKKEQNTMIKEHAELKTKLATLQP